MLGKLAQEVLQISHVFEAPAQHFLGQWFTGGEQQRLDEPNLLGPLAHRANPLPSSAQRRPGRAAR